MDINVEEKQISKVVVKSPRCPQQISERNGRSVEECHLLYRGVTCTILFKGLMLKETVVHFDKA